MTPNTDSLTRPRRSRQPRSGPARPVPRTALLIPRSTYRFQFNSQFTFRQAIDLVDYLDRLGIGGCYSSPLMTARAGSVHGYDVVRHDAVNPEIGSETELETFATSLADRRMAFVMDMVPNHMCITSADNKWWNDVLENGPSSPYAKYFDILWNPPKQDLHNKVLLPFLGEQYGRMLESQEVRIIHRDGRFLCEYYSSVLPVAPRSWALILEPVLEKMRATAGPNDAATLELESIITAISHLPLRTESDPVRVRERYREKEIIGRRVAVLESENATFRDALAATIAEINGTKGDPRSFDRLEAILDDQTYRLCFWRVAADEINYRRFFDISDLAAIRVEEREVFDAVHNLALKMISRGWVTGLRIDHVDGLYDPRQYLEDLQATCLAAVKPASAGGTGLLAGLVGNQSDSFYVVVEKILVGDERLRDEWATCGMTGYEFMNDLNGIFVNTGARRRFIDLYSRFTGRTQSFPETLATTKKFIMLIGLASELRVLTIHLDRISEQHRWSRDFTQESLRFALREVIAYFPVYRSYTRPGQPVSEADRRVIDQAIRAAKRHNPATDGSIFDFIRSVLLLEHPDGLTPEQIGARLQFVMRFQQLTSPVMAKGMEDTAFYRYFPLASLNEVGGEPDRFGISVRQFHDRNLERQEKWPHSLSATTTHDTKRNEDVRARINVLSEIPVKWYRTIRRWEAWNRAKKAEVDGRPAPDANEEYLFYQTVVGTWPLAPMDDAQRADYAARLEAYLLKASKEAKIHTSWINPNEAYEKALSAFVRAALDPVDNRFLQDLEELQKGLLIPGLINALGQTLVKITAPGVPDFYQGTEMWNFSLVDPDNRRPVDYGARIAALKRIEAGGEPAALCADLLSRIKDGDIKLYIIRQALELRRREEELFRSGAYQPLTTDGPRRGNIVSFARTHGQKTVVTVVSRFLVDLSLDDNNRIAPDVWIGTGVALKGAAGAAAFRDVLTGRRIETVEKDGKRFLPAEVLFATLPMALLESVA